MCPPKHAELHIIWNNKILIHCCIMLNFSLWILLWCTEPQTSVYGNNCCLLWDNYEGERHNLYANCKDLFFKGGCNYSNYSAFAV
jgi:hypothetical protein